MIYNDNGLKGPLTPNQGDYSHRPFPTDFGRIFSFIWIIVCFSTIIGICYWIMTSVIYSIFSHIDWPSTRFHSDISNRISVNAILFLWNMQMHGDTVNCILFPFFMSCRNKVFNCGFTMIFLIWIWRLSSTDLDSISTFFPRYAVWRHTAYRGEK